MTLALIQAIQLPGISIVLSVLVALLGVLMYALSNNPKVSELGRLSFFAGLLAFLLLFK